MGNFQDSRFLGFSSRTLWVSIAVVGVVVGLFFIPEIIKFQFSSPGGAQRASTTSATRKPTPSPSPAAPTPSTERASVSPDALHAIKDEAAQPVVKPKQKLPDVEPASAPPSDAGGGFFSRWGMKVKARGGGVVAPTNVSLDKLNTREAAAFFKRGHGDVMKFVDKTPVREGPLKDSIMSFVNGLDAVANGLAKGVDQAEVAALLKRASGNVLRRMAETRVDRGTILEWLGIPIVKLIDESGGGSTTRQVQVNFAPRILLRTLTVRQRPVRGGFFDAKPSASATAEFAVIGNDVDRIGIVIGGQHQRDIKPGRPDAQGLRTFRVRGEATDVWTLVAYDRYSARPFAKRYSFFPRVRRFRQGPDGTYTIAFKPNSAPNSLDRFFFVGSGRLGGESSHDSSYSTF